MNNAVKNVMLRVIRKRMAVGENFEDIIKDYTKLAQDEVTEIREAFNATD